MASLRQGSPIPDEVSFRTETTAGEGSFANLASTGVFIQTSGPLPAPGDPVALRVGERVDLRWAAG